MNTKTTLQNGVSEINKYFQKYFCSSEVRSASLISQTSIMVKLDPKDIEDDSRCGKALRHLKQLVRDMTCMDVESVDIDRYSSGYEFIFNLR
jgi:FtsZ-interacting cell division protein YlmF|nr:MAG TPA: hypothetical protein [Caudoviricetes sp.]